MVATADNILVIITEYIHAPFMFWESYWGGTEGNHKNHTGVGICD